MDIKLVRKWINTDGIIIPLGLENSLQINALRWAKGNEESLIQMKAEREKTIVTAQDELKDIEAKLTEIKEGKE